MKRVFGLVIILLALSFVFGVSTIVQAEKSKVTTEEVDAAISEAQGMIAVFQEGMPTANEKLANRLSRHIEEAERNLNIAAREKERGDLDKALELTREAIEEIEKLNDKIESASSKDK